MDEARPLTLPMCCRCWRHPLAGPVQPLTPACVAVSLIVFISFSQDDAHVEILPGVEMAGDSKGRITTKFMTKYERARVLGTRALQLR